MLVIPLSLRVRGCNGVFWSVELVSGKTWVCLFGTFVRLGEHFADYLCFPLMLIIVYPSFLWC